MALNSSDFQGGQAEFSQIYRGMTEVVAAQKHAKRPRLVKKGGSKGKEANAKEDVA